MKSLMHKNKAKFRVNMNVRYKLTDKDGNVKPIFKMNFLGKNILRGFRKFVKNPIGKDGQVKDGLLNHLAAYGIKVPFLTGRNVNSLLIPNLVVDDGKAGVASRINGAGSEAAFTYIAIGTGTTAAAAGDTALETEISSGGGSRASATASRITTDVTDDTARLVNTFNFTSSFAVTESGVLNAASAGVLLCRQVFSAINVANGDSLQVTWDVDVD